MSPADLPFRSPAPAAAHLPAAVLRQYAAGTLTPAERRRVEHHALDCALCADALEGYQQAAPSATSPAALAELQQRLHQRVAAEPARPVGAWWLSAAAAVVLLLAVIGVWQWPRPADAPVAQAPRPAAKSAPAPQPEPALAAAEPAPATARTADSTVATPAPARPTTPASPAYAANTHIRARRATASATYRAPVAAAAPILEAEAAHDDVASEAAPVAGAPAKVAAAPAPLPPAPTQPELSEQMESKALAKAKVAMGRAAAAPGAAFVADSSAPPASAPAASQPPLREESSKRKAELPPAPALAPFPNGGYPAYRTYLIREQKRPEGVPHPDVTVKVKFTVEADGSVQNIQVVRGISEELDAEAIRLVCEGPSWRPGIVNGRRASQTVRLDVPFR